MGRNDLRYDMTGENSALDPDYKTRSTAWLVMMLEQCKSLSLHWDAIESAITKSGGVVTESKVGAYDIQWFKIKAELERRRYELGDLEL